MISSVIFLVSVTISIMRCGVKDLLICIYLCTYLFLFTFPYLSSINTHKIVLHKIIFNT